VGPPDRVSATNLPTVAQVAQVDPFYAGGHQSTTTALRAYVLAPRCLGAAAGPAAADGRRRAFTSSTGDVATDFEPKVLVLRYHTLGAARNAMATLVGRLTQCWGTHYDRSGFVTATRASIPAYGSQRIGWRQRAGVQGEAPDTYLTSVLVRRGRYLVHLRVWGSTAQPSLSGTEALTEKTLARLP
jgi:hypothetical protein